jgi:hypothetical protein
MSSPFKTLEEFQQAKDGPTEGAIYTFATNPSLITIALLLSVLLLFWFIYASYATRTDKPAANPVNLSLLIVAGLASLFSSFYPAESHTPNQASVRREARSTMNPSRQSMPFALLGLASSILPMSYRGRRKVRSKSRRSSRHHG